MKKLLLLSLLSVAVLLHAAPVTLKTIAFAQDTMANDFRKAQVYEVRDALLPHKEIQFIFTDAKGQTSLLIRQIQKLIDMNVDLIIVGTNDEKAVVPVIAKAYHSGIKVIILDRGVQGQDYDTFINSDNVKIGEIGAEYIVKNVPKNATVLLFEGILKADVTKDRTKGFFNVLKRHPDLKVIRRVGNYLRKDAIIEMEKLLAQNIKIDAIFSQSDSMISGVRSALLHHGKDPGSIIMIGCDYTSEAQKAIIEGAQTGSVKFPLGGTQAVDIAIKLLKGETVPKHIFIPVKLVTRENAKQVKPIF